MSKKKKFTPRERQFLKLHKNHGLTASDLATAYSLSYIRAEQILRSAVEKDEAGYARLLHAIFGDCE